MDPARVQAWQRFFDGVVANGASWPRELWFAAVEDGLVAALSRQSPLVESFRRDAAELMQLERSGRESWHDEQRIAQLEAQIRATIQQADASMRGPTAAPAPVSARDVARTEAGDVTGAQDASPLEFSRAVPLWSRALRISSFGLLLVGAGLLGGVYLYDARLALQVDREVGQHLAGLQASIAETERSLVAGMGTFEREREHARRLQRALATEATELRAEIDESLQMMEGLQDRAIASLEELLQQETGKVAEVVARLQERGAALNRGLGQVSAELATLEERLPGIGQVLAALEQDIEQGQVSLAETIEQVGALQSAAPDVAKWIDAERLGFETALEEKRETLAELEKQIAGLKGELEASGERLSAFDRAIEQQLDQAKDEGLMLKRTVDDLRASSEVVASLVENTEAEIEAAQAQTQERIDAMLTGLAEKADLAVMRGDDVMSRAQAEAMRRVETAQKQALQSLDRLRAEEIAGLAEQIAATRTELEQTREGLVASWQRMDRFVAQRHNQLLSELDRYAQTMEARVQQLLEVLNVMVAQTEQKKS